MALPFTSAQKKVIDRAWSAAVRVVENDARQEARLSDSLRATTRHFGTTHAKAILLWLVDLGMREPGPERMGSLALEDDERLLAYMVGVFIRAFADERAARFGLARVMADAREAYTEAQNTHLASL